MATAWRSPRPDPRRSKNPEPAFFILGAKSYGRNSAFLLQIGHAQIRSVFQLLQTQPDLDLYETLRAYHDQRRASCTQRLGNRLCRDLVFDRVFAGVFVSGVAPLPVLLYFPLVAALRSTAPAQSSAWTTTADRFWPCCAAVPSA